MAHSPQPSGALRLVDVDKVGHHAALQQAALCLHPYLRQHKNSNNVKNCLDVNLQHMALCVATARFQHCEHSAPVVFKMLASSFKTFRRKYILNQKLV